MTYRPRKPITGNLICHTVVWTEHGHGQMEHFADAPAAQAKATGTGGQVINVTTALPLTAPYLVPEFDAALPAERGVQLVSVTAVNGQRRIGELEITEGGETRAYRVMACGGRPYNGTGYLGTAHSWLAALALIAEDFEISYQQELCDDGLLRLEIDRALTAHGH